MQPTPGTEYLDPINTYLEALASASPTPGGGSAASLVGALGAALVAMVARLTVGKPAFAAVEGEARHLVVSADDARRKLAEAMISDEVAFRSVMAAYRMPRDTDTARAARRSALASASRAATAPPLETARIARGIIDLALVAAKMGNPSVTSDAAVAAWAAHAAIRASAVNVRVNLAGVRDPMFAAECDIELSHLIADAGRLAEEVETVSRRPTA